MASPSIEPSIKGLYLPRDPETRNEVYGGIVKEYIRLGKGRKLRMMVVGEAGQGKSTLINALVGQEIAKEGGEFEAGTTETKEYILTQNGVHMGIWDTPGFGVEDEEEDEKIVENLKKSDCHPLDLALFCMRMDITRIPTRVHIDTIKKLTEVFGKQFWKHCVFVLTFANNVEQLCPANEEMETFFSNRLETIEERLRQALVKHAHLSDEEIAFVRAVPVGSAKQGHEKVRKNPWALPDREDWFLGFWMDIASQMNSSALSTLLQANYHRIEAPSCDTVSLSVCPPPEIEPHLRLLESTEEERLQLRDQMSSDLAVIEEADETSLKYASAVGSLERRQHHLPPLSTADIKFTQSEEYRGLEEYAHSNTVVHQPDGGSGNNQQTPEIKPGDGTENANGPTAQQHEEDDAPPTQQIPIHDREIPWREILIQQLKKENSGFFMYMRRFAEERGNREIKVIGHLKGFIEGAIVFLRRGRNSRESSIHDLP